MASERRAARRIEVGDHLIGLGRVSQVFKGGPQVTLHGEKRSWSLTVWGGVELPIEAPNVPDPATEVITGLLVAINVVLGHHPPADPGVNEAVSAAREFLGD